MDKRSYKRYLADLREVLNHHDPIRLLAVGAPEDEYDLERSVIGAKLVHCCSVDDVQTMVYDVFCEYFGADTAGARDSYVPLAEHLWNTVAKGVVPPS